MNRLLRSLSIAFTALLFPFFATAQHDLSVGVTVNNDTALIGASRTFTVTVYNQGGTTVTGVHLSTLFTSGLTSISGTTSTGTYAANDWNIGTISASTASVSLTLTVTASAESVQTLTAQISAMVETDGDSSPNNNDLKEDDLKVSCISVPIYYCDGSAINLTATATAGMTYQWYKDGVLISGAVSQTYNITAIGSYTYTATSGALGTCSGSTCCPIIVRYVPSPSLTTTPVSICNGSSTDLTLRATDVNSTTGTSTFYPTMADATAQTNALASTTVSPTATTTYYVRKNVTTNGYTCNDIKSIVVTVHAVPSLTTTPVSICNGSSTDLTARVTDANSTTGTTTFYPTMADATAQTNALASSTVSPTTTTTYFVRKNTSTSPICNDIKSIVVTVHAVPSLTTTPISICNGSSTDLTARVTDANSTTGTTTFYPTMADATAETNALASSTVSPTATTTYFVRKNTSTSPICNDIKSIVVTVHAVPSLTTTDATICTGSSIDLAGQVTDANSTTGTTTFYPTMADATAQTNALASSTVSPTATTTYFVRKNTSTTPICNDIKSLVITVNATATAGTGTNPANVCQAGSGIATMNLEAQIAGETAGGKWSQIANAAPAVGTALDINTGTLNLNGLAVGTYVFRYTVKPPAPCPTDTEDITVVIEACCPAVICLPVTVVRN